MDVALGVLPDRAGGVLDQQHDADPEQTRQNDAPRTVQRSLRFRRSGGPEGRRTDGRIATGRCSRYQTPVFGIEDQGSAGANAGPACSSSIEMPSGDRTNAIRPSRGGRLIRTPLSCRCLQVA